VDRLSVLLDMAKILHVDVDVDVESLIGRRWQFALNGGAVAQGADLAAVLWANRLAGLPQLCRRGGISPRWYRPGDGRAGTLE
jgi:hypothetical protein